MSYTEKDLPYIESQIVQHQKEIDKLLEHGFAKDSLEVIGEEQMISLYTDIRRRILYIPK